MTHIKNNNRHGLWLRLALFTVVCMLGAKATCAYGSDKTITKIVLDTDYTMPFGSSYYSFDAPTTGVLTLKSTGSDVPRPCTDETFATQSTDYTYSSGAIEMNVVAGTTYYFSVFSLSSSYKFRATMNTIDDKLDTLSVSPAPGGEIDITNTVPLSLQFNKAVSTGDATIVSGTNSATIKANVRNDYASFNLKSTVFGWMKDNSVKAGDKLTVTINDICSALNSEQKFGTDGTLTLEYYIPAMPTMLESKAVPEKFLSYWTKGDAKGIITLNYDHQLSTGATATLTFGNVEDDNEFYKETVPVDINGKTLTVDLTGKIRTPKSMLPNSSSPTDYTSLFVRISGIKDTDDRFCYAEGQSSYGSFQISLPYENVAKDVATEFTPKSGSDISDAETIELWIAGKSALLYSGVSFAYTIDGVRKTAIVKNSDITETVENDDEYALTIPVPEEVRKGTAVFVSLADLQFTDGQERDITARYNTLKLTLNKPSTTELAVLKAGDEINIATNMKERVGHMLCQLRDLNAADGAESIVKPQEVMVNNGDGTFSLALTSQVVLMVGHEYSLDVVAYRSAADYTDGLEPVDTASVILKGTADSAFVAGLKGIYSNAKAIEHGIYTIGGTRAANGNDKSTIDQLPNGLYIVDGKKVTVRK